jgi:hypothetical protein
MRPSIHSSQYIDSCSSSKCRLKCTSSPHSHQEIPESAYRSKVPGRIKTSARSLFKGLYILNLIRIGDQQILYQRKKYVFKKFVMKNACFMPRKTVNQCISIQRPGVCQTWRYHAIELAGGTLAIVINTSGLRRDFVSMMDDG